MMSVLLLLPSFNVCRVVLVFVCRLCWPRLQTNSRTLSICLGHSGSRADIHYTELIRMSVRKLKPDIRLSLSITTPCQSRNLINKELNNKTNTFNIKGNKHKIEKRRTFHKINLLSIEKKCVLIVC